MDINEEKTTTKIELDMSCICREEGKAEADALRAKIRKELKLNNTDDLVSTLIASLWWDYQCTIEGIYMDMWFGIAADNADGEKFFQQCDTVEDGLATIWNWHFENKQKTD